MNFGFSGTGTDLSNTTAPFALPGEPGRYLYSPFSSIHTEMYDVSRGSCDCIS